LLRLDLQLDVFGASSATQFAEGKVSGRWFLGRRGGRSVGGLAWFTGEQHVSPLRSSTVDALVHYVPGTGRVSGAPWELFEVAAPKKKKGGFRGGDPRVAAMKSVANKLICMP
jgi:hypothetical protein